MLKNNQRKTVPVRVGPVIVGGDAPIVVQSMTNTDTADVESTTAQITALANAGSELVRITVNNEDAAQAVPLIRKRLDDAGITAPLIGDFHYNGHLLLTKYPQMAQALAKYRINPGNVGAGKRQDENFKTIIDVARQNDCAVRIGVNWGSLDKRLAAQLMDENAALEQPRDTRDVMLDAMVVSALRSAESAESLGMARNRIILSVKVSGVVDLWDVYARLAERCDYALHLGLTEAGMGAKGIVNSTAALAPLLARGIGNTIRVSLTPEPGSSREKEVEVAQLILQSMGLRSFFPSVTACPGCGRTTSTLFQELASNVQQIIKQRMPTWRTQYPNVETLRVAVMGCVVNGPGESKHADIGISLPGTGEAPRAPVYVDGKLHITLQGATMAADFAKLVERYVHNRYGEGKLAGERL